MFDKIFTTNDKNIVGLTNELQALYIYNYYLQTNKSICLVVNSLYEANKMYQTLHNYTKKVVLFPMDDFLTSVALAVSPELKMTRIETIKELTKDNKQIVITNLMGFLRYLPNKDSFNDSTLRIEVNKDYDMNELVEKLTLMGYKRDAIVTTTGEMAVRGYILDIFPISSSNPIRLEFFGDTIEDIREFNVDTQLMIKKINNIEITPITESIKEDQASIIDYFDNYTVFYHNYSEIKESYKKLLSEIDEYNKTMGITKKHMHELKELETKNDIYISQFDNNVSNTQIYNSFEIEPFSTDLTKINTELNKYLKDNTVVICLSSRYQVNKILENLDNKNMIFTDDTKIFPGKINLIIKEINKGFIYNNLVVISENELLNKKDTKGYYKNSFKLGTKIRDINKLEVGDYIVHNHHGIGRYTGITTLTKNGLKKDYLVIEYKGNDKLYIPVEKIELISKYSSNDSIEPKINKLGGTEWAKTKLRIKKKLENIASELLELYAKREALEGFAHLPDDENQIEFEKEFIYDDTTDQLKVTEEIKRDMEKNHPMDRLLCGDVGYGKTEVAFRAMFKAVLSGKQVAYLCPTTILSTQHYNCAIERFKSFPVNIRLLNRFVSTKDVKETITDLKEGKVDIVIGTHRLLSDDVVFKNLGRTTFWCKT